MNPRCCVMAGVVLCLQWFWDHKTLIAACRHKRMTIPIGEATPYKNTATRLNPIEFDEAALAKLVENTLLSVPEEDNVETPPEPATEVEEVEEAEDPPAEEEVEEPDESQDQDDHSQDQSHKGVQKRIDKLTAQRKAADEKAAELERELNELRGKLDERAEAPPVAKSEQPFADVWDANKLRDEYSKARQLKRWCEDNVDGAELGDREYSDEEVKAIRRKVEDALDIHIPARATFLQQHAQLKPIVEQTYPFWKDRTSTDYQEAQNVLRSMPDLALLPEYQILIGDFLEGRKARMARGKNPLAPKRTAPRQPAQPSSTPARVDPKQADASVQKSRFSQSGSVDDLGKLLEGL